MSTPSAIEALSAHINELTGQIDTLNSDILLLQNNALYASQVAYMTAHNISDVNSQLSNPNFPGNQYIATGGHANAVDTSGGVQQYNSVHSQISTKIEALTTLQGQLDIARQQLVEIQKTLNYTPGQEQALAQIDANNKAEIAKTNYMQATTKYYIIAGVVIVLLVIGGIIIAMRIKKSKTQTSGAVA